MGRVPAVLQGRVTAVTLATLMAGLIAVPSAIARVNPQPRATTTVTLNALTTTTNCPATGFEGNTPGGGSVALNEGQTVTLCASVSGSLPAGAAVLVQESPTKTPDTATGAWQTFELARLTGDGEYTGSYHFAQTTQSTSYAIRVVVQTSLGPPLASSRVVYANVTVPPTISGPYPNTDTLTASPASCTVGKASLRATAKITLESAIELKWDSISLYGTSRVGARVDLMVEGAKSQWTEPPGEHWSGGHTGQSWNLDPVEPVAASKLWIAGIFPHSASTCGITIYPPEAS
jgi:hypothetical protein